MMNNGYQISTPDRKIHFLRLSMDAMNKYWNHLHEVLDDAFIFELCNGYKTFEIQREDMVSLSKKMWSYLNSKLDGFSEASTYDEQRAIKLKLDSRNKDEKLTKIILKVYMIFHQAKEQNTTVEFKYISNLGEAQISS